MQIGEIASRALPILVIVLIVVAIWAVIEIALTLRKTRSTIEEASEVVEVANKTIAGVDPLIERATLTVDALNLELMRVDQILEDVEQVTDAATSAAENVSQLSAAPKEIANNLAERLRSGAKSRSRERAAEKNQAQSALEQSATATQLEAKSTENNVLAGDGAKKAQEAAVADTKEAQKPEEQSTVPQGVTIIEPPVQPIVLDKTADTV